MKRILVIAVMMTLVLVNQVVASELPEEAQRMVDDLGAAETQQSNNGKTLRCLNGGSKTILITPLADATMFSGDYNNCREDGSTRDGYYEVIIRDWKIVGQSSRRSINGNLYDAVRARNAKTVRAFIAQGADVNYAESLSLSEDVTIDGWTSLMSAVSAGDIKLIKLLVKAGASVNAKNSRGSSALSMAAAKGSLETVKFLLANKADINIPDAYEVTPLMASAINGHLQVARFLIAAKADLNHKHKDGDSALMFAIANRHTKLAQLLIDAGADIAIRNRFGVSALLIAIVENDELMVKNLLQHKADLTVQVDSGSVMDIAIKKGNENIISMIRQGLDKDKGAK